MTQEPRVDVGQLVNIVDRHPCLHAVADGEDPLGVRTRQAGSDITVGRLILGAPQIFLAATEPEVADFETTQGFLERLLERAADGHRLADRLHLHGQFGVGLGELFEGPARDLGHDVVDRRLKARQRFAGDVVLDLVEAVSDSQLGSDLGDGEAGGLRGQSAGARHARVHLDDDHAARFRIDRELDVRAPGLNADLPHDGDRGVAHPLILFIGQRLNWCDGDRVTRVHAHRVEILDRTDDHDVIRHVAHHLHLVFLPPEDRLLEQNFVDR